MAFPQFIAATETGVNQGNAAVSVDAPTGVDTGDYQLVVLGLVTDSADFGETPDGWTLLTNTITFLDSGEDYRTAVYESTTAGAEPFTMTLTGDRVWHALRMAWSLPEGSAGRTVDLATAATGPGTDHPVPAVTTTASDSLVVGFAVTETIRDPLVLSAPDTMTEIARQDARNDVERLWMVAAETPRATPGDGSPGAFTTDVEWQAQTFAVVIDGVSDESEPILETFGWTTPGGSSSASNTDRIMLSVATPSASGQVLTGHARLGLSAPGSSTAWFVIYADDGGAPGELLAHSEAVPFTTEAATEYEFEFTGDNRITITAGTPYWIGPAYVDAAADDSVAVVVYRGSSSERYEQNWNPPDADDPPEFPATFGTPAAINPGPVDAYVTFAVDDDGGPSEPERLPAHAGEANWIGAQEGKNHFKIDIGLGNTGGTDDLTLQQSDIEAGVEEPGKYFLTTHPTEGAVVEYRINAGASRTTENTDYPRSEHREVALDGDDNFGWDGAGVHYMRYRAAVTEVAPARSWVCFGQIHDANRDNLRIQTEGTGTTGLDVVVRWNDGSGEVTTKVIDAAYDVGQFLDVEIRVEDDIAIVNLDGAEVFRSPGPMNLTGAYFKFGCYLQVSPENQGADPDEEGAVQVVAGTLQVWHTGYPEPTEPVFTGPLPGTTTHRFYLTNAPSPIFRDAGHPDIWDDSSNLADQHHFALAPAGPSATADVVEETTTVGWIGALARWVSDPATANGRLTGEFALTVAGAVSDTAADMRLVIVFFVVTPDDQVRGTAIQNLSAVDWDTTGTARLTQAAYPTEVDFFAGDRLVLDLGVQAGNDLATPYSFTVWHGATDGDLVVGDTGTAITTRSAWMDVETTNGVTFEEPTELDATGTTELALDATGSAAKTTVSAATSGLTLGATGHSGGRTADAHGSAELTLGASGAASSEGGSADALGTAGLQLGVSTTVEARTANATATAGLGLGASGYTANRHAAATGSAGLTLGVESESLGIPTGTRAGASRLALGATGHSSGRTADAHGSVRLALGAVPGSGKAADRSGSVGLALSSDADLERVVDRSGSAGLTLGASATTGRLTGRRGTTALELGSSATTERLADPHTTASLALAATTATTRTAATSGRRLLALAASAHTSDRQAATAATAGLALAARGQVTREVYAHGSVGLFLSGGESAPGGVRVAEGKPTVEIHER